MKDSSTTSFSSSTRAENFSQFRDIFSSALIEKVSSPPASSKEAPRQQPRTRKGKANTATTTTVTTHPPTGNSKLPSRSPATIPPPPPAAAAAAAAQDDAEALADFTEYVATLTFDSLPEELQTLTRSTWTAIGDKNSNKNKNNKNNNNNNNRDDALQERYALPLTSGDVSAQNILHTLDPAVSDSLVAYGILLPPHGTSPPAAAAAAPADDSLSAFLAPILTSYLATVTAPTAATPAPWGRPTAAAAAAECELCGRDWIPLTYHHLIPRFVHAKAVKRGWHRPEDLQSVAWLCRACHSFVHRFAAHEALARDYFTVERLLAAPEVESFARWVSRVRWKAR